MAEFYSRSRRYLGGIPKPPPPKNSHSPEQVEKTIPPDGEDSPLSTTLLDARKKLPRSETGDPEMDRLLVLLRGSNPLPPDLTSEHLIRPVSPGHEITTLLHVAAARGLLDKIPTKLLTSQSMLKQDENGRTPLHRAVSRKKLEQVPTFWMTKENLLAQDTRGQSVIDFAHSKDLMHLIPEDLRVRCSDYGDEIMVAAIQEECFESPLFHDFEILSSSPASEPSASSWFHVLASHGYLLSLPAGVASEDCLELCDNEGRTPLHVALDSHGIYYIPESWITTDHLAIQDASGRSGFHIVAAYENLGDVLPVLFSRHALSIKDHQGVSVADVVDDHGNTGLLPSELQWMSRTRVAQHLQDLLGSDYLEALRFSAKIDPEVLPASEVDDARIRFVQQWSKSIFDHALDEKQAEAVLASGCDLLVSARAGSGKTGTLVARALFEIEKRKIDPRRMLILAFNKKAAQEVRDRLAKHTGEERCPHVLTFHSLAYRLVHPERDSILMDAGDTDEGQTLSRGLNNLIDEQIREGKVVEEIRRTMEFRWKGEWDEIVDAGGLLPQEDVVAFRECRNHTSIDGRHFESATEKHIANELVRHGKRYLHRKTLHRFSGMVYKPAFAVYDGTTTVVIDIAGTEDHEHQQAQQAYWRGVRSEGAVHIQLDELGHYGGVQDFKEHLQGTLDAEKLHWERLSDDELWELVRDRTVGNFTRAVISFIGRCQKELWTPEELDTRIIAHEAQARARIQQIGDRLLQEGAQALLKACTRFWKIARHLQATYLSYLKKTGKTDFDHLMMDAAATVRTKTTRFRSEWSHGDIAKLEQILIDEYQDFSHLFNNLREAIQERSPDADFFCVGDDWQAINGFAGSNLRYFHGFSELFPDSQKLEILKNYRSAPEIVSLGNRVMEGKGSPSIPALSIKGRVCQIFAEAESETNGDWEDCIEDQLGPKAVPLLKLISKSIQANKELLVLFRNRNIWTASQSLSLKEYRRRLLSWLEVDPKERLVFSTTHSYKGGEADWTVVVDPQDYPLLHQDRIFSRIFGDTDASLTDDEQRLFYVALTRAREQLIFLPDRRSRIEQGRKVLLEIPFLPRHRIQDTSLSEVKSPVFPADRCLVRVSCGPHSLGSQFRDSGFIYIEERRLWRRLVEQKPPRNRFECGEFLKSMPWLTRLESCTIEFEWKDKKESFGEKSTLPTRQVAEPTSTVPNTSGWKRISNTQDPGSSIARASSQSASAYAETKGIESGTDSKAFRTSLAGTKYANMAESMSLERGDFVRLLREPQNPHDKNAIKAVSSSGTKIGYIPRKIAMHLAHGLDAWGGEWSAKITSIQKQTAPHAFVAVVICFPLPPDVKIPEDLDQASQMQDSPWATHRASAKLTQASDSTSHVARTQLDQDVQEETPSLSPSQEEELELILDPKLREMITGLARTNSIPFPVVGYDGGIGDVADGSQLEVAWPDYKIGIAISDKEASTFRGHGWTIFRSDTVRGDDLRSAFQPPTNLQ